MENIKEVDYMKTIKSILLTILALGGIGAIMLISGIVALFAWLVKEKIGDHNGLLFCFAKITYAVMEK